MKMGDSDEESGSAAAAAAAVNTPLRRPQVTNVTNNYAAPVAAVSIKVPPFWSEQPSVWFSQLESQFTIKNITAPATKFAYVVSNLTQEVAVRIPDLIASPPPDPYNSIKARLIAMFVLSDYQKAETLVNLPAMGDQKPTVLMDKMLHLLPAGHDPCFLFKFLFLQRLPADLRVLLMNDVSDLPRDLAAKADVLWTARSASSSLSVVSVDPDPVCALPPRRQSSARSSPPSTSSSAPARSGQGYCWYHAKYGAKAHKCESPCSWRPSGNSRSGR